MKTQRIAAKIDNITISYLAGRGLGKGRNIAVKDVSFSIQKERCLALVGESGSGKSTIAKGILGLTSLDSGSIEVEGFRRPGLARNQEKAFRKAVQVVFQDPYLSLNPRLSVGHLIEEPLIIHSVPKKERKERVERVVEQVRLEVNLLPSRPSALSGGQRQRVCIARALVLEPKFLIADEPVSSLDLSVQGQIVDLLGELKREHGLTMLFVSHDIELVQFLADDVAVLYAGQLMEEGPAADLLASPRHPYTRALLDAVPTRLDSVTLAQGEPAVRHLPGAFGCPYHPSCPHADERCAGHFPDQTPRKGSLGAVWCYHPLG